MRFNGKKILKWSLLAAILFGIIGTILLAIFRPDPLQETRKTLPSSKMASGEGITFYEAIGDKRVYRVKIGSFSIERAKLGPFAIGPLQIAHLNKIQIDLYSEGLYAKGDKEGNFLETEEVALANLEGPIANIRKNLRIRSGKVKRLEIKDISLNLWRDDKRVFRIAGDRATIDRQSGDIIFVGHASLDAGENGSLISHRIRWVRKTTLFRITDPYILSKGNEKKEGKGMETDYLLKKINYQTTG